MKDKNLSIISVIIPTYNRAGTLPRAIQSVLDQTYDNIEVIIIDDGSTDNTREVVDGFEGKNIKYIRFPENRGAPVARNEGIMQARSEFIAFQDSDDEWLPEKLKKQMDFFENAPKDTGVVYTGVWRTREGERVYVPLEDVPEDAEDMRKALLVENFVPLSAAIVRKECFSQIGMFDESLPCLQDWELWIRMSKKYKIKYLKEGLVNAFYGQDSISLDLGNIIKARETILEKHFKEFKKANLLGRRYVSLAHLWSLTGDMAKCRGYLGKAVKENPLGLYNYCAFMVSFLGQKTYRTLLVKNNGNF